MSDEVVFKRIRGRIVPIKKRNNNGPSPHQGYKLGSHLTAIASGVLPALLPSKGLAFFAAANIASIPLDIASTGMAIAAYKNDKNKKRKIARIVKTDLFNTALSYGAMGGTLLAQKSSREFIKSGFKKLVKFAK